MGLTAKVTFKQKLAEGDRVSHVKIWGESVVSKGHSQCKGHVAEVWQAHMRNIEEESL